MAVYFVRAGEDGPVKIGFAIDVAARIKILQCGLPVDLVLVREVAGGRAKEAAFHRHFGHLRIRGEWFRWDDEFLIADVEIDESADVTELASPTMVSFLVEVEQFCRDVGMSEAAFSRHVAKDGKFLRRLKSGADMWCDTLDRARAFIAEQRAARTPSAPAQSTPSEAA